MVKKNRTCERCGYTCATPQKLRSHLKRKNPCRPQNFVPKIDEEFQRLSNITEENGENIIFREQQLGPALKRRAVAVHNAK
ncbi:22757_t:CDS:1, partial [Entrophospora sp. SA101]